MALVMRSRGSGALCRCLLQQEAALQLWHSARIQSSSFASSSDEEGLQNAVRRPAKPSTTGDDPKARAEYRTWVENMLTALQAEAEGRPHPPSSSQAAAAEKPAEDPTTGSTEGNQGLALDSGTSDIAQQALVPPEATAASAAKEKGSGNLGFADRTEAGMQEPQVSSTAQAIGLESPPSTSQLATRPVPTRTTVREVAEALPDSVLGYRNLGISESGGDGALLDQGEGKINRSKQFWPSEFYDPEDLVTAAGAESRKAYDLKPWMKAQMTVKKATNAEALKEADFRNLSFLHKFTSGAGQLPPRRVTKLQQKVHVHVMRQIKIARQMALLPPEGKLEELQLRAQEALAPVRRKQAKARASGG